MAPRTNEQGDPDLITVQSFAEKYRVDASVVRSWVKQGLISYELVGPRKMLRKSELLKPIIPSTAEGVERLRQRDAKDNLIGYLMVHNQMDLGTATTVAGSMSAAEVDDMLAEFTKEGTNGAKG